MIAALALAAVLAAMEGAGPASPAEAPAGTPQSDAPAPRMHREVAIAAGPWLGTFHGLELRGVTFRGAFRIGPLRGSLSALVPLAFELALEGAGGRTPNGVTLADVAASGSLVLGDGNFTGAVGGEAGILWIDRATTGGFRATDPVFGPRIALRLDVPVGGRRLLLELAVRATAADYVRGVVLLGVTL